MVPLSFYQIDFCLCHLDSHGLILLLYTSNQSSSPTQTQSPNHRCLSSSLPRTLSGLVRILLCISSSPMEPSTSFHTRSSYLSSQSCDRIPISRRDSPQNLLHPLEVFHHLQHQRYQPCLNTQLIVIQSESNLLSINCPKPSPSRFCTSYRTDGRIGPSHQ